MSASEEHVVIIKEFLKHNRKSLENEKVAIYPFGQIGKAVESEAVKQGINIDLIVDNRDESGGKAVDLDKIIDPKDYIWILATSLKYIYTDIWYDLINRGVPQDKILDICGVEKTMNIIKRKSGDLQKLYLQRISKIGLSQKKLRFGVYLMYYSNYGAKELVNLMLKDKNRWDVKIVIIPAIFRGDDFKIYEYMKTKKYALDLYDETMVLDGYNFDNKEAIDYSDEFDIVYCSNPYDADAEYVHSIKYLSSKILPIYINYGYDISRPHLMQRLNNEELNYVWKCFADTMDSYKDYVHYQPIKGGNVVLTGYAKMDELANVSVEKGAGSKKILITSHHTIADNDLPLSNFIKYSEYYKNLPLLYPNIKFVFRPHPLLFVDIVNYGIWTEEDVVTYVEEIQANGMEYSTEGDYLGRFVDCDAIINDCGTFTVSWLFTGKPGCFLKNEKLRPSMLTELMNHALEYYDIAQSEEDIDRFIKKIESDDYDIGVDSWVKENVMINYPNASEAILNEIDIIGTI